MGLFSSINPLVKIAKSVVNNVRKQLMQQVDLLETAVQAPIQAMVSEVTGGMWTGKGADAFVEQCTNLFIPETEGIVSSVTGMHNGIGKALEIMEGAEATATSAVGDLADTFQSIY